MKKKKRHIATKERETKRRKGTSLGKQNRPQENTSGGREKPNAIGGEVSISPWKTRTETEKAKGNVRNQKAQRKAKPSISV